MVRPDKALRSNTKHMYKILPQKGMYYSLWEPDEEENNTAENKTDNIKKQRRILPPNMSTKIMLKFYRKHKQAHTKPVKSAFDHEVADLFIKAKDFVLSAGYRGLDPSYNDDFWRVPKTGTFLETVSDTTASRFAAKMLQAREAGLKRQGGIASEYDCETAQAIDLFNQAIPIASVTSGGAKALIMNDDYTEVINFSMASYINMAEQFDDSDDTDSDESDNEPTGNKHELTDDAAPAAKCVKVEEPMATDGEARPSFDLGTTPLTIRPRAAEGLNVANKNNAKEPSMPPANNFGAALDVAPTVGNDWPANLDAILNENPFVTGNLKSAAYYDEVLARYNPNDDWEMDWDMDD